MTLIKVDGSQIEVSRISRPIDILGKGDAGTNSMQFFHIYCLPDDPWFETLTEGGRHSLEINDKQYTVVLDEKSTLDHQLTFKTLENTP